MLTSFKKMLYIFFITIFAYNFYISAFYTSLASMRSFGKYGNSAYKSGFNDIGYMNYDDVFQDKPIVEIFF
uniref:Uncharacterized protein n=1 Tax=Strongyloides papillosus TaxID=174720 RepID=A0A0N5BXE8_STREA